MLIKGFTNLYEQQGDFQSALESYYKYVAYADSVRDDQYNAELEALTQNFQKNQQLKLSEEKLAHSEEVRAKQKVINIILTSGLVIVFIAIIVVFILYRRSVRNRELLLATSKEIEEKNIKIDKALQQKETLLKEVHHRVKNNLQLIASLLNLQSATITDETAQSAINESKSRVQAIALMHKGLYQDDNYNSVELDTYINELVENLRTLSQHASKTINFELDIEPVHLNIDKSVPIGLIISELISNSLKHAFAEKMSGEISISIKKIQDKVTLTYADDGQGLPEDFDMESQESMGFTVINALTDQIEGSLIVQSFSPFNLELIFFA